MVPDGLLIREVAKRSGISRKAIRLHEAYGLLLPSRRAVSGYRVFSAEAVSVLTFVEHARRLGLSLAEIGHIVGLGRSWSAPCVHVRQLLEQKAADLTTLLRAVRRTLRSWPEQTGRDATVCPRIERKEVMVWTGTRSLSARSATTARRSLSTATRSGSGRTPTRWSSGRTNGTSSWT